ncbi:MAG: lysoplasmalogenase [Erysipelotrichaceae bacterium]|nr:lysoplasmalogenase [Erysipelotrichaceae bacterium]
MIYYYLVSNLLFVCLLIQFTFKGESNIRFIIKLIACLHFVALALFALSTKQFNQKEIFLCLGLVFSFFGDLALGLKYKYKQALKFGLLLFMGAQVMYIISFGFNAYTFMIWIPLLLMMYFMGVRIRKNKHYNFKNMGLGVIVYACLLSLMMSTALAQWDLRLLSASFLCALGAILFLGSDFLLLHLYFYDHKKTSLVILYLILYHVGQNCLALSLWVK